MSSGWQQVEAPPLPVLGEGDRARLVELIAQGEAVLASKQAAKGRMIGDWQSVETVYAVVNREAFMVWRGACQQWLDGVANQASHPYPLGEGRGRESQTAVLQGRPSPATAVAAPTEESVDEALLVGSISELALTALEAFLRQCARPQYAEAMAGVKMLRHWAKA